MLVSLQRSAGNRAVGGVVQRLLHGSSAPVSRVPGVQRAFLDQKDKHAAVGGALKDVVEEVEEITAVLDAVQAYDKLGGGTGEALETALSRIISTAQTAKEKVGSSSKAAPIFDDLEKEASATHLDVVKTDGYLYAAKRPEFAENSDLIADARGEVRSMMKRYGNKHGKSTQQALYDFIVTANDALAQVERNRIQTLGGADNYNYGDSKTGKIDPEVQGYLDAFNVVSKFLDDKPAVLRHLQPLAEPVNKTEQKLDALKQELRRKESEAGFGAPKVPLGILPGEVFVSLLRDGTVLDDFGAGLQHGELSHRIQWYAIIDFMQNEGKELPALQKYTPLDLFKQINAKGFSPNRQGNTMWGTVLDKGTSASSTTYRAPGTLNRDLLESSSKFQAKGVGLAERDEKYKLPTETKGLASIGEALIELRNLRMEQAEKIGGVEGTKEDQTQWEKYGTPTPKLAGHIEESMSKGGGYEVSDRGISEEGKEWRVLKEVK